jgi:hypothetical protein
MLVLLEKSNDSEISVADHVCYLRAKNHKPFGLTLITPKQEADSTGLDIEVMRLSEMI